MSKLNGLFNLKGFMLVFTIALTGSMAYADIVIDGQTIPGSDINSININPSSGRININTTGYTVTKNDTPPGALVVTFSSSATSVTEGQTITLSWTTQNAASCSTAGAWSGPVDKDGGSRNITLTTAGSYTYTLDCVGTGGDTLSRSVTVIVQEPVVVPTSCPTPALFGTSVPWKTFWGKDFPGPAFGDRLLDIPRTGYTAIEFDTEDFYGVGSFLLIQTTTSPGVKFGAISECPGDFDVKPLCDHVWGLSQGITWGTIGHPSTCQLKAGTKYYFNVTFTDGAEPSTTSCVSKKCVARVSINFRDLE